MCGPNAIVPNTVPGNPHPPKAPISNLPLYVKAWVSNPQPATLVNLLVMLVNIITNDIVI
jgi:hypothetical protein